MINGKQTTALEISKLEKNLFLAQNVTDSSAFGAILSFKIDHQSTFCITGFLSVSPDVIKYLPKYHTYIHYYFTLETCVWFLQGFTVRLQKNLDKTGPGAVSGPQDLSPVRLRSVSL